MPKNVRETYKSMRGHTNKEDDKTQSYWVDAAKDIGLANSPHGGVIFKRDPSLPSLADNEDDTNKIFSSIGESTFGLIRRQDKHCVTDFYLFLFKQVIPCRFEEKDRRKGTGLRRDHKLGFPGLQCRHCVQNSHYGRYFPYSSKSLADNTTHSLYMHIQGCKNCPEMIKSCLAYLTHRSLLQKIELKRGWKRDLFNRVWERLHSEDSWVNGKFVYEPDEGVLDNNSVTVTQTSLNANDSLDKDKGEDDEISIAAQILMDIDEDDSQSQASSDVDSDDLGSDIGDAIRGVYPRRSKRRRTSPQSPVLTRARRSSSLLFRGDVPSRVTRKRRCINAG